jgi:hypothetical protein
MYSYHNFLFPFRFDYLEKGIKDRHDYYKEYDFDKRVKSKLNFLFKTLQDNQWEYKPFNIEKPDDYNDFVYFHDFVKDSLFNQKDLNEKGATSWEFYKKISYPLKLLMKVTTFENEKIYELSITSIKLKIFETGIGILSFEIKNKFYKEFEDILKINEFFRRIYPQFVGEDFSLDEFIKKYMASEIKILDKDDVVFEYNAKKYFSKNLLSISPLILEFLGNRFTTSTKECNKFLIQPVIDDRMFVICWYGNNELSEQIKKNYEKNDNWYKFIFIDVGEKTIQDCEMQKEILKNATYTRWKNYGTFYGISRYSFVGISSDLKTLKKNYADFIVKHFRGVYFQMIILVLALRASILRFSDEVTAISDLDNDKELFDRINVLFKNYLKLRNKLYFKEITPQEQGIELYNKIRKQLNIDSDIGDLNVELYQLNDFTKMKLDKEENKETAKLTKIATYFLPPTLIAGIFGMNVFGEKLDISGLGWLIFTLLLIISSLFFAPKLTNFIDDVLPKIIKFFSKEKNEKS